MWDIARVMRDVRRAIDFRRLVYLCMLLSLVLGRERDILKTWELNVIIISKTRNKLREIFDLVEIGRRITLHRELWGHTYHIYEDR